MSGNEDQSNGTQPAQVCALSRERLIELGVSPENIEALTFQPVIRITPTATTLNNGSSNTVHQQTVSNSPPLNTLPNSLSAAGENQERRAEFKLQPPCNIDSIESKD